MLYKNFNELTPGDQAELAETVSVSTGADQNHCLNKLRATNMLFKYDETADIWKCVNYGKYQTLIITLTV